jgi:glycogen operon protein
LDGSAADDVDLYLMVNAYWEALEFQVQEGSVGEWSRVIDTGLESPDDIVDPGQEVRIRSLRYSVGPRSVVLLSRSRLPPR